MEISRSDMSHWGSSSNTLCGSTARMFAEDCNDAPLIGYYQRLLYGGDMIVPHGDDAQMDYGDLEQMDWERAQLQSREPSSETIPEFPTVDAQQLHREPSQELLCPSSSETIPEFPTVDQSEETNESGEKDGSEEEDRSTECDGERSHDHADASTGGPTLLPKLPCGKKMGVCYHKKNKQWEAHLWVKGEQLRGRKKKGVQIFLGNFEAEEDAKIAHDRAAIKLKMPPNVKGKPYALNFPEDVHASFMEAHADWTTRDFLWKVRRTSNKFSKGKSSLRGVTVRKPSGKRRQEGVVKYESRMSVVTPTECGVDEKQTLSLGSFESEEEAGKAYDRAQLFLYKDRPAVEQLRCVTNYKPSTYSDSEIEGQPMADKLSELRTKAKMTTASGSVVA